MSARTHTVRKLAEMIGSGQRAYSAVRAPGFGQHSLKLRPAGLDEVCPSGFRKFVRHISNPGLILWPGKDYP